MPKLPIRKAVEVSFRVKLMAITRFTKTKSKIITGICVKNKADNNKKTIMKTFGKYTLIAGFALASMP